MNNLIYKNNITLYGAGGGGGKSDPPPPANVNQYPAVLTPPQFSKIDSISSFSYAEIVDLLSDGPIEGLVNKNKKKVYEENIFEGIYLNGTPVKETSSEFRSGFDIAFLKDKLKTHFANKYILENSKLTSVIFANQISNKKFTTDITITSYHPKNSIYEFVNSLKGSFDAIALMQKVFDSSTFLSEKPFLTKINIPKFSIALSKSLFDVNEGGSDSPYPLKMAIVNLSNHIYYSIGSDNLNSFNYFELPRSFIDLNSITAAGKKTFKKNLTSTTDFYTYDVFDLNIYIWSIYSDQYGMKDVSNVLDKYFNEIIVYQNQSSLFNYNLIQSEFKNGSEIQAPLQYFASTQIDVEYQKQLIGPYKICNNFSPSTAFGQGGVQRVLAFSDSSYGVPATVNTPIESETSDDIRYVRSWPIEYDCKGFPWLICNVEFNFSNFDKTSCSRIKQDAVPITHYIENDNVEEVFLTLGINQLYDTNHIDLVNNNTAALGGKYPQGKIVDTQGNQVSDPTIIGVNTYTDLAGYNSTLNNVQKGKIYFLIYGTSFLNGYILDGCRCTSASTITLVENLKKLNSSYSAGTLYYKTISQDGLGSKIPSIRDLIGQCYMGNVDNGLIFYELPNDNYIGRDSFSFLGYSMLNLENKLKITTDSNEIYYCFGLNPSEKITSTQVTQVPETDATFSSDFAFLKTFKKDNNYNFYIGSVEFTYVKNENLLRKYIVATKINNLINWSEIVDQYENPLIKEIDYPNIYKFILNPYLILNSSNKKGSYLKSAIGNIFAIGISYNYLLNPTFTITLASTGTKYLKLTVLEQLIEDFVFKRENTTYFSQLQNNDVTINDVGLLSLLKNNISKFKNGFLVGNNYIFSAFFSYASQVYIGNSLFPKSVGIFIGNNYNLNKVFLFDENTITSNLSNDIIIGYDLYSSSAINNLPTIYNSSLPVTAFDLDPNTDPANPNPIVTSVDVNKILSATQQITVGTKLPAVVVVDVETGYEKKEYEEYIGNCEYFNYTYCIFGMAQESALVDLGRKQYSYIAGKRNTSLRGGYTSKYKNNYYDSIYLYLLKVERFKDSLLSTEYFLLNRTNYISIGSMSMDDINTVNLYDTEYIKDEDDETKCIGLKQNLIKVISGADLDKFLNLTGSQPIYTLNTVGLEYSYLKNKINSYLLTNSELDYFYDDFSKLDLSKALPSIRTKGFLPTSNVSIVETVSCSKTFSSSNNRVYDTYLLYDSEDPNDYVKICKFNFCITPFETIEIDPSWLSQNVGSTRYINYDSSNPGKNILADTLSTNIYLYVYYDEFYTLDLNENSFFKTMEKSFANDLILGYENFVLRFSKNQTISDPSKLLSSLTPYNTLITNTSVVTSSTFTTNSPKTLAPEKILDTKTLKNLNLNEILTKNIDDINIKLINKGFFENKNLIIDKDALIDSINVLYWSFLSFGFQLSTGCSGGFLAKWGLIYILQNLYNDIYTNYFIKKNSNTLRISNFINLPTVDKRLSLISSLPPKQISTNANFWAIHNHYTGKLSFIFKKPSIENDYLELESLDTESFLLNDFIEDTPAGYKPVSDSRLPVNINITSFYDYYNVHGKGSYVGTHSYSYQYVTINSVGNIEVIGTNTQTSRENVKNLPKTSSVLLQMQPWGLSHICEYMTFKWPSLLYGKNYSQEYVYTLWNTTKYINCTIQTAEVSSFDIPCCFYGANYSTHGKHLHAYKFKNKQTIQTFNYNLNCTTFLDVLENDKICVSLYQTDYFTCCALIEFEKTMIANGYLRSDMRIQNYSTKPAFQSSSIDFCGKTFLYFKGVNINNFSYYFKSYNADGSLQIQIPKPKKDSRGNSLRRFVRVTKRSHETLSSLIEKNITLHKVTEVIPQRFSYPFSAIVGTKIDSRAFNQIPTRTFHCKLKKILIPSNYFIYDNNEEDVRYKYKNGEYKIYDGDWDGTFKLGWSNNPAWILLDLLINKRYGLGNYIESDQIDIWELYKIARWCDGVNDQGYYYGVSDNEGGVEPRHTWNGVLTEKFNVFDMVNQVASIFRGKVYYMNSLITFDDDRIKPIVGEFNNSDVKDGLFTYTNSKKDDEFTVTEVSYIDAKDNYKPKIEYVEDPEGIRQRGILKKELNAFGVTSKSQARRFGLYYLYLTSKENSNVTFTTDQKALLYRPGDLIRINDELFSSYKNYGNVKKITDIDANTFKIVIDKKLDGNIYNTGELTLYSAIAKPKYEDYSYDTRIVPNSLTLKIASPLNDVTSVRLYSGSFLPNITNQLYKKLYFNSEMEFNLSPSDSNLNVTSFSGKAKNLNSNYFVNAVTGWSSDTTLPNSISLNSSEICACLNFIPYQNMNGETSKYGHWQFTTTSEDEFKNSIFPEIPEFIIKLDVDDELKKFNSAYKYYYFNEINTGRLLIYSGLNDIQEPVYYDFDYNPNQKFNWSTLLDNKFVYGNFTGFNSARNNCFSITVNGYDLNKLSYENLIESNKPIIDSFYIKNFETGNLILNGEIYNEYTEITLCKKGKNISTSNINQFKDSLYPSIDRITEGSSYSLNLNNKNEKIYKIVSMTENYINEYNIMATEFNFDKFKEIEDNSSIDNLKNTFNYLGAYNEPDKNENILSIKAPIISSLKYFKDTLNNFYLEIKWNAVVNANLYELYLETPSKNTPNYIANSDINDFNKNENCFIKIIKLSWPIEIGTYSVNLIAINNPSYGLEEGNTVSVGNETKKQSSISRRSINIINY